MSCLPSSPPAAYELQHSNSTAAFRALKLQHSNSTAAFRASKLSTATAQQPSELQHSSLQSCSTGAFRAAAQQQHSSLQSSTATAQQQHSSLQSCELQLSSLQTLPKRRTPSECFKVTRAVLQALCSPYDCRPYGLQPSKLTDPQVPNSTPCLETRPVAITEWELTTPSLERA